MTRIIVLQDYLLNILVRQAYHSCAIEGSRLSLAEVKSILVKRIVPSGHPSIQAFYEVENHRLAFFYLLDLLEQEKELTMGVVLQLDALLMDRITEEAGLFKTQQNAIIGANFQTASPEATPTLMQQWLDNLLYRLELATSTDDYLEIVADTHIQFERIHPFSDGNGRVGRLLVLYLGMKYLEVPLLIQVENRAAYIECLATENIEGLQVLLRQSLDYERAQMRRF